jgi:hypothetical protein
MSNAYVVSEGTTIRFYTSTPFTSISGAVVNPDVVKFAYQIQGQTPVTYTWTNPTGDPSAKIVNTATGYFQADISTNGLSGVWTWQWSGQPSTGIDSTHTAVVTSGTVTVSQSGIH